MENNIIRKLYYQMLRIRMTEEKIAELYHEQEMRCPVHLCIGEEAIAAGVCETLSRDDYVFSNPRSHGHYLAKGGDLKAMIAELYGKATGCAKGKGGSMHLIDLSAGFLGATAIVAGAIPIATGAAMASMMKDENCATVIFLGDAAVEEGVFHESLNFAALKKLPIVFICENNFFSVYSPLSVRQPDNREIYELAKGHGVESRQGDGNDVMETYKLAKQAIQKAKDRGGPTFLEFKTYRHLEHCGPNDDDELGYREKVEVETWKRRCPIKKIEKYAMEQGFLTENDSADMKDQIKSELEEAVRFAKESPFPEERALMEHVYAA